MKAVLCVLPLLAALVCSLPTAEKEGSSKGASFASATSQLIAMQLLKFNKDIDANQVHSPLGVTSILGVLAEASEGETYAEFTKVFGYPKDRSQLRDVYRRVLGRYQNRDSAVALPSFQTCFYIYRNHSAREEFKELRQQHYFVEEKQAIAAAGENPVEKQQNKRSDNEENQSQNLNLEENETVQEEEKLRKVVGSEAVTAGEPEKVRLPLQKLESAVNTAASKEGGADEIMLALESHLGAVSRVYGARSLFRQDDITSALSANSITGRSAGAKSKMLLFNGLYYRGSWATPFYQLRDGSDEFFFMTNEDAMKAPMMHTRGQFLVADLPQLKARVLSLPYETSRYALCILLPDETEGLHDVIAQMQPSDFQLGREKAQLRQMHVSLPKFQVEETSRSESMLKQMGLRRLFSRTEAQLGLLSEDPDVHVDEIVQFVNVRVDEGGSSANALSAATQARSPQAAEDSASVLPVPEPEPEPGVERFEVNRPFAYFIMDCEEQFVLASGKVYTPEFKDDLPGVSVEIELEQS
ncbi:GL13512 [Drosophila persimilis]|uniref:GL13512 n=1 Tax=Drosophila persimilis TaxID=7234 RepID=B4GNC5_DROPE|nr:GL13512 [Drosophila persimilis]